MTSPSSALASAVSPIPMAAGAAESTRLRWFEVCLATLVAIGGFFFNSLYIFHNGLSGISATSTSSNLRYLASIVHEIVSLLLLGYVLHRRGRRVTDLGLRWSLRDIGIGPIIVVASYGAYDLARAAIYALHLKLLGTVPLGHSAKSLFGFPPVMALVYALLNPFFEELIVRAYLMTEIIELTGSGVLAVVLSTVVQASYHLYYGWWIALSMSCQFLVLSLYYARRRRAVPLIVAHEFFDILPLIRLWMR